MLAPLLSVSIPDELIQTVDADFRISAKTSIYRSKPSLPARHFIEIGQLDSVGSLLHFGKGKYDVDSVELAKHVTALIDYDYTYCKTDIIGQHFDAVIAIYVLNTLPPRARAVAWQQIKTATRNSTGKALIAVRSDKENVKNGQPEYDGLRMVTGTFQTFYNPQKIMDEALEYFEHVEVIKYVSGMLLAVCRSPRI